ncbi:MAG: HAD family phosphatase [Candidatus Omnitrophota bacterium]
MRKLISIILILSQLHNGSIHKAINFFAYFQTTSCLRPLASQFLPFKFSSSGRMVAGTLEVKKVPLKAKDFITKNQKISDFKIIGYASSGKYLYIILDKNIIYTLNKTTCKIVEKRAASEIICFGKNRNFLIYKDRFSAICAINLSNNRVFKITDSAKDDLYKAFHSTNRQFLVIVFPSADNCKHIAKVFDISSDRYEYLFQTVFLIKNRDFCSAIVKEDKGLVRLSLVYEKSGKQVSNMATFREVGEGYRLLHNLSSGAFRILYNKKTIFVSSSIEKYSVLPEQGLIILNKKKHIQQYAYSLGYRRYLGVYQPVGVGREDLKSSSSGLDYAQCKQNKELVTEPVDLFDLFRAIKGPDAKLEAVILDHDGVMVNTEPIHYAVQKELFEKELFSKYGKTKGEEYSKEIDDFTRGTLTQGCLLILKYLKLEPSIETVEFYVDEEKQKEEFEYLTDEQQRVMRMIKEFTLLKQKYFREYIKAHREKIEISPGLLKEITFLKSLGIKVGVASSSRSTGFVIETLGLKEKLQLDAIVTGLDVNAESSYLHKTIQSKPEPDLYLECAYRMGVAPENCIVVEDSLTGVMSAKGADMVCLGFLGFEPDTKNLEKLYEERADIVIKSFKQFDIAQKSASSGASTLTVVTEGKAFGNTAENNSSVMTGKRSCGAPWWKLEDVDTRVAPCWQYSFEEAESIFYNRKGKERLPKGFWEHVPIDFVILLASDFLNHSRHDSFEKVTTADTRKVWVTIKNNGVDKKTYLARLFVFYQEKVALQLKKDVSSVESLRMFKNKIMGVEDAYNSRDPHCKAPIWVEKSYNIEKVRDIVPAWDPSELFFTSPPSLEVAQALYEEVRNGEKAAVECLRAAYHRFVRAYICTKTLNLDYLDELKTNLDIKNMQWIKDYCMRELYLEPEYRSSSELRADSNKKIRITTYIAQRLLTYINQFLRKKYNEAKTILSLDEEPSSLKGDNGLSYGEKIAGKNEAAQLINQITLKEILQIYRKYKKDSKPGILERNCLIFELRAQGEKGVDIAENEDVVRLSGGKIISREMVSKVEKEIIRLVYRKIVNKAFYQVLKDDLPDGVTLEYICKIVYDVYGIEVTPETILKYLGYEFLEEKNVYLTSHNLFRELKKEELLEMAG